MNELQYCEPRPYRVRPCNVRRYPAVRRRSRTRLWTKTRCVITDATDFLFTSRAERIHSEAITDSYVFERFREACTIGADLFTARKPIVPTSKKKNLILTENTRRTRVVQYRYWDLFSFQKRQFLEKKIKKRVLIQGGIETFGAPGHTFYTRKRVDSLNALEDVSHFSWHDCGRKRPDTTFTNIPHCGCGRFPMRRCQFFLKL